MITALAGLAIALWLALVVLAGTVRHQGEEIRQLREGQDATLEALKVARDLIGAIEDRNERRAGVNSWN